ncbi:15315_t:CDS:2, partial [Acaulospora colombiana]
RSDHFINHTRMQLNEEGLPFVEIVEKEEESESEKRGPTMENDQGELKQTETQEKRTMSVEDEQLFDALIKDEELEETIDSDDDEDFEGSESSDYEDKWEEETTSEVHDKSRRTKKVTFADQTLSPKSKPSESSPPNLSMIDIYNKMLQDMRKTDDVSFMIEEVTHPTEDLSAKEIGKLNLGHNLGDAKTSASSVKRVEEVKGKVIRNKKFDAKSVEEQAVKNKVIEKEIPPEEQDADSIENEIWMKEIASEYHQKRLDLISQQGELSPPSETGTFGIKIPGYTQVQDTSSVVNSSQPTTDKPKKVSRFKAARLKGQLE